MHIVQRSCGNAQLPARKKFAALHYPLPSSIYLAITLKTCNYPREFYDGFGFGGCTLDLTGVDNVKLYCPASESLRFTQYNS